MAIVFFGCIPGSLKLTLKNKRHDGVKCNAMRRYISVFSGVSFLVLGWSMFFGETDSNSIL